MLKKVGIRCFLKPEVPGFSGVLKKVPADFQVIEVDSNNKHCDTVLSRAVPEKNAADVFVAAKKEKPKKYFNLQPPTDAGWTPYLLKTIGPEVHSRLQNLDARAEGFDNTEIEIKCPTEKLERCMWIRGILMTFPCVKPITERRESVEQACVLKLSPDTRFEKLIDAGVTTSDARKLLRFFHEGSDGEDATSGITLEKPYDRESRKAIHHLLQNLFPTFVSHTGKPSSQGSTIRVCYCPRLIKKRKRQNVNEKQRTTTEYIKLTLQKTDLEHFRAKTALATGLGVSENKLSFAGIKDKRAITYQNVVAADVRASRLLAFSHDNLRIGNLEYCSSSLSTGSLCGNRFKILITSVDDTRNVNDACESLKTSGFINYYGLQRVGLPEKEIRSPMIGLAILKQQWQKVLEMLLSPKENDNEDLKEAKRLFLQEKDVVGALKRIPVSCHLERSILQALGRWGIENSQRVVQNILPYSYIMMQLHSFQSYLFNELASARIEKYGSEKAVIGDLVQYDGEINVLSQLENSSGTNVVMLPLPGTREIPREAICRPLLESILQSEVGGNFESICHYESACKSLGKGMILKGTYRPLHVTPENVIWKVKDNNAVTIDFELPSGSYATICLWELLKTRV